MRLDSLQTVPTPWSRTRRTPRWVRGWRSIGVSFVAIFLAALLVDLFGSSINGINILWAANGLLLTYLMLVPRWLWERYAIAGFMAMVIAAAITGELWKLNLLNNTLNMIEAYSAALLLRPRTTALPCFTNRGYLLRFVAYAVFIGPAFAATLYALVGLSAHHPEPGLLFLQWIASDSLGMAVIPPTFLAIYQFRFREKFNWKILAALTALTLLTLISFSQSKVPLSFFLFPLLVWILLQYGIGWAAMSMLLSTSIGGTLTINGYGPFAILGQNSPVLPGVLFQCYLASGMCTLYMTSLVMENLRSAKSALDKSVTFHEMVAANLNEVIIVDDLDGRHTYVSPAASKVIGMGPAMLTNLNHLDLVHPDEQATVLAAFHRVRMGKPCPPVEFRIQKQNGQAIWVEAGLKLMRDPSTGVQLGILNILRDVTERKKHEEQLREAYCALEALAITDALTHLANRRHFDKFITAEWRRTLRTQEPIAVLVMDVDYFKLYNDAYGHLRGDSCLRQVAEAAQDVVMRTSDLVARIGGEEFAVVLQGTDLEGAAHVAEKIRQAVVDRNIKHESSPLGHVTISIGCASCTPRRGQRVRDLIDRADQALYRAKRSGRNRIDTAATCERTGPVAVAG